MRLVRASLVIVALVFATHGSAWAQAIAGSQLSGVVHDSSGGAIPGVEVTATKTARRSDPEEVEIKVLEDEDGVTICVLYPSPRNQRPNECGTGEHGHRPAVASHGVDGNARACVHLAAPRTFRAAQASLGTISRPL